MSYLLPKQFDKLVVPPIKCQGIKTKLVKFIGSSIKWDGKGRWIEPFLGSGVVVFNIQPERALLSDTNKHIIDFYKDIQQNRVNEKCVRDYLYEMGDKLSRKGESFFYEVREEFNKDGGDSFKLLFLNRCCFNGLMRFNSQGKFNVPFGHKPNRFKPAYITKITNQVARARQIIKNRDWKFVTQDWRLTMSQYTEDDFVYADPPYIGRHTDYFNSWGDDDAVELAETSARLNCGFALSMWKENKYRENTHLKIHWDGFVTQTFSHFYHIGSKEEFRNQITEALVLSPDNVVNIKDENASRFDVLEKQLSIFS